MLAFSYSDIFEAFQSPFSLDSKMMAPLSRSLTPDSLLLELYPTEGKQPLVHGSGRATFKKSGLYLLLCVWLFALIAAFSYLCFTAWLFKVNYEGCYPDDTFSPFEEATYNYFSASGFFQVTLGFGSMTFTQAKVCDVIWDLVGIPLSIYSTPFWLGSGFLDRWPTWAVRFSLCFLESFLWLCRYSDYYQSRHICDILHSVSWKRTKHILIIQNNDRPLLQA